jgi:hypothetical protein
MRDEEKHMAGSLARRVVAAAGVSTLALAASPLLSTANAAAPFAPDYDTSAFTFASGDLSFASADSRPGTAVMKPSSIAVHFNAPVKLLQLGNDVTVQDTAAAAPYFIDPDSPATHHAATATASGNTLRVTPPATMPDGVYQLHVTAFDGDECADATIVDVTRPSCTTYDGFVTGATGNQPFEFTLDTTAPSIAIQPINGGSPINADEAKNLVVAGTASADTKTMSLSVRSSGGGLTQIMPVPTLTPHAGAASTWTSTDTVAYLLDGTLQFTALGTDWAGNKTDPTSTGARRTATLAAHPSAPRSFTTRSADASIVFRWATPTSTGGDPITGYRFSATDTTAGTGPVVRTKSCGTTCPTSYTFTGLNNGHNYQVTVAAVTDVGRGALATGTGHPKAATTLTVKRSAKTIVSGQSATIHGRLSRTATGSALGGVILKIKPVYDNGKVGDIVKIKTDLFGVYSKTFKPTKSVKYVVIWVGDSATQPARGSTHVGVTAPALPHTG